jgi:transcriptional regulator with XRE-family HTH domain
MAIQRVEEKKGEQVKVRSVGKEVGERISIRRREQGLSLEALAAGTGLTPSYLSKLERGRTSISVDNLRSVAQFLGVEMVYFFEKRDDTSAVMTKKGEGTPLTISDTTVFGESLVTTKHSSLQATLYRTPSGGKRPAGFSHPGEEFVYVTRGRVRYWVGSRSFLLRAGDTLWHRSSEPHHWECVGRSTAVTLHVNSPPVW